MSDELPRELRERIRAYLEDVAPPDEVDDLEARIHARLAERSTRQPAQVMAIAHELVASRVRITPDAAAAALVDHGGLSPMVAAHVVGLPVDGVLSDPSPETPAGPDTPAAPETSTGPGEAGAPVEPDDEPIIEGWDDFWTPPADAADEVAAAEDVEGEEEAATGPPSGTPPTPGGPSTEPVRVRPDAADRPAARPVAPVAPGGFQTWTGGATRQRRGTSGALIAVVVGLAVVALAVVGLLAIDDEGEQVAVGDPTGVATNDAVADGATEPGAEVDADSDAATGPDTDAGADKGADADTDADTDPGAVTVEGVEITAEDGGSVRAGATALVSFTVAGTEDRPATLQWELRRDGEAIFPAAPLVVPADGRVQLAVPPALLSDTGEYLLRVTRDGATLLERGFAVSTG